MFFIQDVRQVSQRDRLIVMLLLFTGMRVSELVNLRLRDIDFLGMNLHVAFGKGGKVRDVPLKSEVSEVIREYLEGDRRQNKSRESEYLLLTQRAGKIIGIELIYHIIIGSESKYYSIKKSIYS